MKFFLHCIGPGVFLRVLLPQDGFTLTGYLAAALMMEAEYWIRLLIGQDGSGLIYSRTILGAVVIVGLLTFAASGFLAKVRKMAWKTIRPHGRDSLNMKQPSRQILAFSAFCGAAVAIVFTSLLEPAAQPFWPLSADNPLNGVLDAGRAQRLATLPLPLALTVWGLKKSFYAGRR
ncbi:hypothetical protein C4J81_05925 [Deltaproteobacteria bacterium Smac51]|nr:hypothetical protein C4J81_05925 [Deltaproteobacteria bacterium Smac51]